MKDKVILITGAAHRVGAQTTRMLHASGANIVLHYRRSKTAAAPRTKATAKSLARMASERHAEEAGAVHQTNPMVR